MTQSLPRRPFALLMALLLLNSLALSAIHGAARAQSTPEAVRAALPAAGGCAPPCWQGLRPGYITYEAQAAWLADPPYPVAPVETALTVPDVMDTWRVDLGGGAYLDLMLVRVHSRQVDRLEVRQPALRLGDLLAALGEPAYFDLRTASEADDALEFRLFFPQQRVQALGTLSADQRLSPETPIAVLVYDAQPLNRPLLAQDWRGLPAGAYLMAAAHSRG